jgi:hypothetical protein
MTEVPDRGDLGPGEFYPVVGVGPHPLPWPTEAHFDKELLELGDRRNVVDKYRYWSVEAIVADLDTSRAKLHIAIENWQHDLNIGSVVRTANAFNVTAVHIVGKKGWNRRGAMVTDRYLHLLHHPTVAEFVEWSQTNNVPITRRPATAANKILSKPAKLLLFGRAYFTFALILISRQLL